MQRDGLTSAAGLSAAPPEEARFSPEPSFSTARPISERSSTQPLPEVSQVPPELNNRATLLSKRAASWADKPAFEQPIGESTLKKGKSRLLEVSNWSLPNADFEPAIIRQPSDQGIKGPYTVQVTNIEILRLVEVNEVRGTFSGQIYIEMTFPNAADDPQLTAIHPELGHGHAWFPFHEQELAGGKTRPTRQPTMKPNAEWFLEQFAFDNLVNASAIHIDKKVKVIGSDIVMSLYTEGEFYETFELHDFPYDAQDLTFVLAHNCQVDGPFALQILPMAQGTQGHVAQDGFYLDHQWMHDMYEQRDGTKLPQKHEVLITQMSAGKERVFPTLYISVKVRRRPEYYVTNVIVPAQIIVLFALSPLSLSLSELSSRTEIVVGLLITFHLFKYGVLSNMLPHVSYETLLDKSIHMSLYTVSLMAFENLGMVFCSRITALTRPSASIIYFEPFCTRMADDNNTSDGGIDGGPSGCTILEIIDLLSLVAFLLAWMFGAVWWLDRVSAAKKRGTTIEDTDGRTLPAALGGGFNHEPTRLRRSKYVARAISAPAVKAFRRVSRATRAPPLAPKSASDPTGLASLERVADVDSTHVSSEAVRIPLASEAVEVVTAAPDHLTK